MRKNLKKFIPLLAAAALLVSCGKSGNSNGNGVPYELINVGFSQLGAESDWRVANTDSIKKSLARSNGFDLMFDDAQQKQDKQITAIRNFVQQEVDCIVLAPVTETGWDTVLGEAKSAGIPVIVVDRRVDVSDDSLFDAWVGSDFDKEAEVACAWLKSFAEAKGLSGSDLKIVDIQGTLGATAQIGRSDGLVKACGENGWQLLAQVPADYAQTKAKEVMQNLIKEYGDINVVYCENDNEALGAIEALEEAGLKPGTDLAAGEILIISFDAAHSGLAAVLEGKIALDVECNPLQGEEIAELIKAVNGGESYQKYTFVSESAYACDDTVKSVMLTDGEYEITVLTEDILSQRQY